MDLVHATVFARAVVGIEQDCRDLFGGVEVRRVGVARPLCRARDATELEVADRLASDEVEHRLFALLTQKLGQLDTLAQNLRVEGAGEAAVGGEDDDGGPTDDFALFRERVLDVRVCGHGGDGPVTARAKGEDARTRAIAFWMREAAMSSIAFVIFLVV